MTRLAVGCHEENIIFSIKHAKPENYYEFN